MARRVPSGAGRFLASAALFLLPLLASDPASGSPGDPFAGYPGKVREQALRVTQAATPVPTEAFRQEVRILRKRMFDHGIVSLNALPDLVFARARQDGWRRQAGGALREITRVAPLSVPLWAWLVREDLLRFAPDRFLADVEGLAGAARVFSPALPGYAGWLLLAASAASLWFAAWASIALLLRARTALTADVLRLFRKFPYAEIPAALLVWGLFVFPVAAGAGLGTCAVFWIAVSAAYLRKGELGIALVAVILLGAAFLSGGAIDSLGRLSRDTRTGAWLGTEGYIPGSWPEAPSSGQGPFPGIGWDGMVRFSRARAEMQAGNLSAADRIWSEMIRDGQEIAGAYNNRGVVRALQGKADEALSDFEAATREAPSGSVAHWNAYQTYLGMFHLEQAARIQAVAWATVGRMPPFEFRADEMKQGELFPSLLRVGGVREYLLAHRGGWIREAGESLVCARFFRPLPGGWVPAFLVGGCLWAAAWNLLSRKIWLHGACRSCGSLTMLARTREATDICNSCRAQVGGGVRGGEERESRILTIELHRRYVRACSVLVPGSGALWAGKDLRTIACGFAICIPLGLLTVSLWPPAAGPQGLVAEMQRNVAGIAAAGLALSWAGSARWGWRSFDWLQHRYNVAGERS
jgi:tetratricopeptide (TPR) repeat protein